MPPPTPDEEQRFGQFCEALPGFALLVGPEGLVRSANPAARALLGETVGHAPPLFPAEDALWECSDRTYRVFSVGHEMADGQTGRVFWGMDVTDLCQTKRLADRSERRLAAVLEHAQEGVLVAAKGQLVYVNPFMERLTGYDAPALCSRPFTDFIHPQDRETVLNVHRRRVAGLDAPAEHTFRLVTPAGDIRWVNAASTRIEWDDVPASLSLLSDITAQKNAQQALAELIRDQEAIITSRTARLSETNQRLETEILERTRAHRAQVEANARLTREIEEHKRTAQKLKAARKKATQASRAKSVFLANMSHEIRTPLNVILGMADMALRPDSREQIDHVRALAMIREAGTSLRGILGDLLDLSRVEAGRLDLLAEPFEPRRVLEAVLEGSAVLAERQGLVLAGVVDPAVPERLCGDPGRLGQVIGNLVGNALKFTPAGRVDVSVGLAKQRGGKCDPGSVMLLVAVRDTGIGIAPEKRRCLFQNFCQADESIGRRFGGTGLGLAICRRLVGLLGGRIRVKSQPNAGSEFVFTARFAISTEPAAPEAAPAAALPDLDILLAEDSDLSAEMITAFLSPKGHRVTRVVNGEEALSALSLRNFDLVLMDIQMPGMDGMTATRAIRDGTVEGVDPAVPIIALTAYGTSKDRDAIVRCGVTDYLAKPVNLDQLLVVMARVVGREGRTASRPVSLLRQHTRDVSRCFDAGRAEALENLGGDVELYGRLMAVFLRDTPGDCEKLREALAAGDLQRTALQAHSIKGNAGVIGATPAVARARDLELAAREGRTEELAGLVEVLFAELARVLDGLAAQGVTPAPA